MGKSKQCFRILIGIIIQFIFVTAYAEIVTLQQDLEGYAGTQDARLADGNNADLNYGNGVELQDWKDNLDNYRATSLIRFAIFESEGGPVPNDATIESATLSLYKSNNFSSGYKVHRVLKAWSEGEVTWNKARNDGGNDVLWSSPGAGGAGTDYLTTSDGGEQYADYNPQWLDFDVTSGVQAMKDGFENNGWRLIVSTNERLFNIKMFHSSEYTGNTALRPKLVITYTLGSVTKTLQQDLEGYAGTQDARLADGNNADLNYGNGVELQDWKDNLDNYRATSLIRFAIFESEGGPVPNDATIESATLSLYKSNNFSSGYKVHRVLKAWSEGEVTWNKARNDGGNDVL